MAYMNRKCYVDKFEKKNQKTLTAFSLNKSKKITTLISNGVVYIPNFVNIGKFVIHRNNLKNLSYQIESINTIYLIQHKNFD